MIHALPQWYLWLVFGVFSAVVFITADAMRQRFRDNRVVAEVTRDQLLRLAKEVEWWKQAHLKLQGQVIRGREILYERLKVPEEQQDKEALVDSDESIYVQVKCQVCHKNKVTIRKDQPYYGIICEECRKRSSAYWVKTK